MATIEHGAPSNIGTPLVRFSDQPLHYANTEGEHFEKLRRLVTTRFEQSEQYARSKFERFYRWEKLVQMVSKKKVYDWKANAFLPYAYSVAEQSAAIKWLALFGSRPYITVKARRAELEARAKRREAILDWHFTGDINIIELAMHLFRQSERYGSAIMMITPEWNTRLLKYRSREEIPTAFGPIARMAWKMRSEREYKLHATHLDLTDFFPEPGRRNINGDDAMRFLHRRYYLVMDELQEMEHANLIGPAVGGQHVADVRDSKQQELNEYKLRRLFLDKYDDVDRYYDQFDRTVELIEYHGTVPEELLDPERSEMEERAGRNPKERIIIVANRHIILQDIAQPYDHAMKPFIKVDSVPDPYDFWAKGKIEPIEHMNYVGNEIINMRIDNVKMAVNGLIGIDGTHMPTGWKRRLMSQPWGILETIGPPERAVQRLRLGDVTGSSYTEQQQIFSLIQEASAINETMMGAPGPARTLGEHQLKLENSSKRIQFELIGAANQMLGYPYGLAGFIMGLDRQYLPIPTYMNVVSPDNPDDFMEIAVQPDDLAAEDEQFLYLPSGASEGMNIQAKRADLANMLNALGPFMPLVIGQGFNVSELVKTVIRTFGQNPDRYFPAVRGIQEGGQGPTLAPMAGAAGPQMQAVTPPEGGEGPAGVPPGLGSVPSGIMQALEAIRGASR